MPNEAYVALSAQIALERRLETIATNMANSNTPGYRADGVAFAEELARAGGDRLSFVSGGAGFVSTRSGPIQTTGNPLDVAVQGQGWMAIAVAGGVAYTRDGRLQIAPSGALLSADGHAVLDAGGAPIRLDPKGGPPAIAEDGMITQQGRQLGAIGLFALDPGAIAGRGADASVVTNAQATPILDFTSDRFTQGAIEGSNVDPVREMTRLIVVSRAFEGVSAEVSRGDARRDEAIKILAG